MNIFTSMVCISNFLKKQVKTKRKHEKNLYLYAETYNIISFLGARMLITKQEVNNFFYLEKKYFSV